MESLSSVQGRNMELVGDGIGSVSKRELEEEDGSQGTKGGGGAQLNDGAS